MHHSSQLIGGQGNSFQKFGQRFAFRLRLKMDHVSETRLVMSYRSHFKAGHCGKPGKVEQKTRVGAGLRNDKRAPAMIFPRESEQTSNLERDSMVGDFLDFLDADKLAWSRFLKNAVNIPI